MSNIGIVIHTKDLRIYDNRTIKKAYDENDEVLHIFILNPKQLQPVHETLELNTNAIEFMHNSLINLNSQLQEVNSQLVILNGELLDSISKLKEKFNFSSIYISKDYSPFAIKREDELKTYTQENNISISLIDEHLLLDDISYYLKPTDNQMYSVFTPMYRNCLKYEVPKPIEYSFNNVCKKDDINAQLLNETRLSLNHLENLYEENKQLLVKGGRDEALDIITEMKKFDYSTLRDYPAMSKTTHLSAHHKFGTISMRESYYMLSEVFKEESEGVLRELFWHDFYTLIAKHYPRVFSGAFKEKYNEIKWFDDYKDEKFIAWCKGETGYPIVDAGMRELNATGYMHNRVRMVVSSFLTKHLQTHWMLGERYFASKLTDYDSCVNNGSWQWAASTGCDAQPYFRIFNPFSQQKKFDKDCEYIKKWIPELSQANSKIIHNLEHERPLFPKLEYVRQIVNHKDARERALQLFKEV